MKNTINKIIYALLILVKPIYSQTNYSYTFQVVNPVSCGGCCTNTICMANITGACGPIQFAWMTPTSGTVIMGGGSSCTLNLCNGTYTAVVIDPTGVCPITNCNINITYPTITGLKIENQSKEEIEIYPNPTSNILNIQFHINELNKEFTKVEIRNSIGQLLKTVELNFVDKKAEINTNELPAGVYNLIVKSNSQSINRRFVIAR